MAKNKFIIDLKDLNLNKQQRSSLNTAIHSAVSKKLKSLGVNEVTATAVKKPPVNRGFSLAPATGVTATLKVTFTLVDPKLSIVTATYNGIAKKVNKSDTIQFENVLPGKRIKIQGNSLGFTTITIDIDAEPTQLNFNKGKINGEFFID
jgi:hypothetical protein